MKVNPFWIVLICIGCLVSGCEKRLFDYRNKYAGDYDITYYYEYWQMGQGVYESNTLHLTGKVFYPKKGQKDLVTIQFNGSDHVFGITKKGRLLLCNSDVGGFSDRKHFYVNYNSGICPGSGMGGGTKYTIVATRQS